MTACRQWVRGESQAIGFPVTIENYLQKQRKAKTPFAHSDRITPQPHRAIPYLYRETIKSLALAKFPS